MAAHHRTKTCLSIVGIFCAWALPRIVTAEPRHVVVVVWDGMRPDSVSEQGTPALWSLAKDGVTFRHHHAVYLSATNVNGTAIATGDYPGHSGLIANFEFRPRIDNRKPIDVGDPNVLRKGDELSNGKYISVSTIPELVRKSGGRTVIAASKTVGLLQDRRVDVAWASQPMSHRQDADATGKDCVVFSAGLALPNDALMPLVAALGPFPKQRTEQDNWTAKALTDVLWRKGLPAFSLLWLGEPDLTQHETAPGSDAALRAIKSSDDKLGAVLAALDRLHARETTDIFVVSDHGFSTIEREVDLRKILKNAGFSVATEFKSEPRAGDIMMVGAGGSVLFYVTPRDPAVMHRLVGFLQESEFAGVIFTKETMKGTFTLDQAKIDSPDAPDVALSFRWNDEKNQFGIQGMIDADWQRAAGEGTHATLSRFDMHNTLITAGPDFRRDANDDFPSGNIDLAPTVLRILGIDPVREFDGRILSEAMVGNSGAPPEPKSETIKAVREFPAGTWHQSIQISRVGSTTYIDEGNGAFAPK
jgi:arylsulfatase A-like enzyme